MATTKAALDVISSARLSHTEHIILNHFIEEAIDSELAAQYLLSRLDHKIQDDVETKLRRFMQDWTMLASRRE